MALAIPGVIIFGYYNRRGTPNEHTKGIGWQFIRYTVIGTSLPIVCILALNNALAPEAVAIIAGALGYAFGQSAKNA